MKADFQYVIEVLGRVVVVMIFAFAAGYEFRQGEFWLTGLACGYFFISVVICTFHLYYKTREDTGKWINEQTISRQSQTNEKINVPHSLYGKLENGKDEF